MRTKKFAMPALIAFLSLGFFSQSPLSQHTPRRISSFDCANCSKDQNQKLFDSSLNPLLVSASVQQNTDAHRFFAQQVQFQAQMKELGASNAWMGFRPWIPVQYNLPVFPSYALPLVSDYQAIPVKPVNHIFGGFTADPALQYLTKPAATQSVATEPALPVVQNSVLEAQPRSETEKAANGLAPSPNGSAQAAPIKSSSFLGSVPLKGTVAPSISFTNSKK